jgi:MFS family permease
MTSPIQLEPSSAPTARVAPGVPLRRPRVSRLKSELRWISLAWVFGSLWMWITSGATWTQFAQAIQTPNAAYGIISALPFIGILMQLPASYYIQRYGRRRTLFLFFTTLGRLMWVVLAVIPWVLPASSAHWWYLAILALFLGQVGCNSSGPAWSSWMADVVPRQIRGRYFSFRNRLGQGVGVVTTLFIGWVLDQSVGPHAMLVVTSILLAVAGLSGAMDIQCHQFVADDYPCAANPKSDFGRAIRQALGNQNFRNYLAFNFLSALGCGFLGQYVWLYILNVVKMGNMQANLLVVAVPLVLQLLASAMWGRLVDRLGKKPVLIVGGMVTVFGSVGWVFMGPDAGGALESWHWHSIVAYLGHWHWQSIVGYALLMLPVLAQPGADIANFNIVIDLAAGHDQNTGGTAHVAILSVVVAVGGAVSGFLAAGAISCFPEHWHLALPLLGIVLTYHGVLFLASTGLRLAGMAYAFKLHEPTAADTSEAINQLTDTIYSNVREAMLVPTRAANLAVSWTAKLNYRNIQRLANRVVGRDDQPGP